MDNEAALGIFTQHLEEKISLNHNQLKHYVKLLHSNCMLHSVHMMMVLKID